LRLTTTSFATNVEWALVYLQVGFRVSYLKLGYLEVGYFKYHKEGLGYLKLDYLKRGYFTLRLPLVKIFH